MVIADSNFGPMLHKYLLKLFTMSFLLFVNDPFISSKSGSLCFLLFLFRMLFIVDHVCSIFFFIFVKTGIIILFFRCMDTSFQNSIKSFNVSCSRFF